MANQVEKDPVVQAISNYLNVAVAYRNDKVTSAALDDACCDLAYVLHKNKYNDMEARTLIHMAADLFKSIKYA